MPLVTLKESKQSLLFNAHLAEMENEETEIWKT